ncbi:phosphate ABC transporter ATP-binding protein PstB [Serpentinicella alkaliphila]|uniref:Phosphate ABC transporter ATP-binding protein (PhoT family) n=1 Tax=Serpentinicella alkaliphila TaxID=1734049 RepID=A0A4R2TUT1_9FIRM|nr:phosphate ABC transporter ATP-binding protein PstB [Serpentinicella alkaliphila]QUH27088.1 phosphate ABC transporter ATP-binding protein [Serpentinicella alkaliphila]TCQ05215.1 phosphate ABC transporter ATP-binding protein (PhoT family) [Serpentinicella alkaliphila]
MAEEAISLQEKDIDSNIEDIVISIKDFNAWYGNNNALSDVNMNIKRNAITAFIGPSGCGKTTLLRSINRMNDVINGYRCSGIIKMDNIEVTDSDLDTLEIRRKIGMVFQDPNAFPMSIYDNLKLPIVENFSNIEKKRINEIIIEKLKDAALYDEVKDRLHKSALKISGGQQQRLCIARALTIEPKVILFDEPCSSLDPIATLKIEELLVQLKEKYTVVIVTHNMEQARRIADDVAFFYKGEVVEQGASEKIFTTPNSQILSNYLKGII